MTSDDMSKVSPSNLEDRSNNSVHINHFKDLRWAGTSRSAFSNVNTRRESQSKCQHWQDPA